MKRKHHGTRSFRVPQKNANTNRIQHTTFTATCGKVNIRNGYVEVRNSTPTPTTTGDNLPISQDNVDQSPPEVDMDAPCVGYSQSARLRFLLNPLNTQDRLLLPWMSERDKYLAEMILLEARGGDGVCAQCNGSADLRCSDCFGNDLFCAACLVSNHRHSPFHFIQVRLFKLIRRHRE
jgi:hypothetical protein